MPRPSNSRNVTPPETQFTQFEQRSDDDDTLWKTASTPGALGNHGGKEDDIWLQNYVDVVMFKDVDHEDADSPATVFEYASTHGKWCLSCDDLAQKLSRVEQSLRHLSQTAEESVSTSGP